MRRAAGHGRHGADSVRALGPARLSAAAARLATVAPRSLSIAQARRAALAASGLQASLPGSRAAVGTRAMAATIARLGLLQLDTVNVFERSHYLPLLARLGPYDHGALDRLVRHDLAARPRVRTLGASTEAWAHEAAIVPVADWPLLRFRADAFRAASGAARSRRRSSVRAHGPASLHGAGSPRARASAGLTRPGRASAPWWRRASAHPPREIVDPVPTATRWPRPPRAWLVPNQTRVAVVTPVPSARPRARRRCRRVVSMRPLSRRPTRRRAPRREHAPRPRAARRPG